MDSKASAPVPAKKPKSMNELSAITVEQAAE
jgi:hypothetical protein